MTFGGILGGLTVDAISVFMGQPPTNSVGAAVGVAFENWLGQKARIAHEILLQELKEGRIVDGQFDNDKFFTLLFRYLNAVKQGSSRRNLRLIAQIVASGLQHEQEIEVDQLASNADILAGLRKDELIFIAAIWSSYTQLMPQRSPGSQFDLNDQFELNVHNATQRHLVTNGFLDERMFFAIGGSLSRTGLVVVQSVWGGIRFAVTPRLVEIMKLCRVQQALDDA